MCRGHIAVPLLARGAPYPPRVRGRIPEMPGLCCARVRSQPCRRATQVDPTAAMRDRTGWRRSAGASITGLAAGLSARSQEAASNRARHAAAKSAAHRAREGLDQELAANLLSHSGDANSTDAAHRRRDRASASWRPSQLHARPHASCRRRSSRPQRRRSACTNIGAASQITARTVAERQDLQRQPRQAFVAQHPGPQPRRTSRPAPKRARAPRGR